MSIPAERKFYREFRAAVISEKQDGLDEDDYRLKFILQQ